MDTEKLVVTLHDINYMPSYKVAEEERQNNEAERQTAESIRELNEMTRETNETNRINNENERKAYYEEIQQKVENGEFDGDTGVYVGEEEPTEDRWEVWIDPSGMPEVEASHLVFADKETLQDKYNNGKLNGKDGTSVTILGSFSNLTELEEMYPTGNAGDSYLVDGDLYVWNEKESDWKNVGHIQGPQGVQGPRGEQGIQGEQGVEGPQGPQGYTPIKGTDYFTNEDIKSILDLVCPIGKIEVFWDNEDHSNHLGFKWERTSIGKVPVGINSSDSDFNAIGKTGGEKTHNHTSAPHTHTINGHSHTTSGHALTINEMPSHSHTRGSMEITGSFITRAMANDNNIVDVKGSPNAFSYIKDGGESWWTSLSHEGTTNALATDLVRFKASDSWTGSTSAVGGNAQHSHGNTGSTSLTTNSTTPGNTGSASSLQPYEVMAFWKRVS